MKEYQKFHLYRVVFNPEILCFLYPRCVAESVKEGKEMVSSSAEMRDLCGIMKNDWSIR